MAQPAVVGNPQLPHPISIVFVLHVIFEAPICFLGLVSPEKLPFLEMSNTTLLVLKLYAAMLLGSILSSVLTYNLPEFLPGKRALALQLLLYHTVVATALWHSPRFIPITLGEGPEALGVTIEKIWCVAHGLLSLAFGLWWHVTLPYTALIKGSTGAGAHAKTQ